MQLFHRRYSFALLLSLIAASSSIQPGAADIGPKPTMTFKLKFKGPSIPIVEGTLLQGASTDGSGFAPLKPLGPQRFGCDGSDCSAMAYGFANYSKLVLKFKDKTRESNVFTKKAFAAKYNVTVGDNDLKVVEEGCKPEPKGQE